MQGCSTHRQQAGRCRGQRPLRASPSRKCRSMPLPLDAQVVCCALQHGRYSPKERPCRAVLLTGGCCMQLCETHCASDIHVPSWLAACTDTVTDRSQVPEIVSARCPLLRDEVAGGSGRSGRLPRGRSAMRSRHWSSTSLRRQTAMLGTTLTPAACQMPRCMTARTMMTTTTSMTRCIF